MPSRSRLLLRTLPALLSLALPLALLTLPAPAEAQKVVPKRQGLCPLGYVDLFNGTCSTLGVTTFVVEPRRGDDCPTRWVNVGGGYCRRP